MQEIKCGTAYPLGVSQVIDGVQFAFYHPEAVKISLLLYENRKADEAEEINLDEYRCGDIFSICFVGKSLADFERYGYAYRVNGSILGDPYAKKIYGRNHWGIRKETGERAGIVKDVFDWEGDTFLETKYSDLCIYQLHVRGFTKHASSAVAAKGCFLGITEKIPYLKDLGVNGLLLLPCYEFDEIISGEEGEEPKETKINYWGYARSAYYFTPKASYAKDKANPQKEMKELVKSLHKEKIEIYMDMYFPEGSNPILIIDCLRFWISEYHIDGFRVNDNVVPASIIKRDPLIGSVKLFATSWPESEKNGRSKKLKKRRLAEFNDGFLIDIRRFLKSDEGQVRNFMYRFKRNPDDYGVINYITSVNGFTLMDLVSYDIKHNEENGEQGKDGTDFNYSWNCGTEGNTRKKQILSLRERQRKNAMLLLFLSQGTPMLLAGDEFGNSQMGNNNAYCQDNKITWLNWKDLNNNKDMYTFVKELIAFRRKHPILHAEEELRGMDYTNSGSPDLSFHGSRAWYVEDSNYSRLLGIMLNGAYQKIDHATRDDSFYLAFNMHWENHVFDLPKLPKGLEWRAYLDSSDEKVKEIPDSQRTYLVKPRSIVILKSVTAAKNKK